MVIIITNIIIIINLIIIIINLIIIIINLIIIIIIICATMSPYKGCGQVRSSSKRVRRIFKDISYKKDEMRMAW